MTMVGYGSENGDDYWLVKNSWGAGWGDNGYIKIKRGKNLCYVEDFGMYPTVKPGGGDDDKTTTTTAPPDSDWKKYKNLDYIHPGVRMNYELAEQFCLQKGGHLVSITSEEQSITFMQLKRKELRIKGRVWIGLNDREQEGQWKWTDESPLSYTNWGRGEPNNRRGQEDCAETGSFWNDQNCKKELEYICVKWNK